MALEQIQLQEMDLEKTDRLPIIDGTLFDHDVEDDAVRLDYSAGAPGTLLVSTPSGQQPDFVRPSGVDLPLLAESVRSVEERIARQNAEYETLSRAYERARDTESTAIARSNAFAAELAAARAALDSEQIRSREIDKALTERGAAVEAARSRVEEALRESERHQGESRTLRESLAARDATIAQVMHSLGERDAQLMALQQEHAKIVPALEARVKSGAKLEADLQATRDQANATAAQLKASQESATALGAKLKRAESSEKAALTQLAAATVQANSYHDRANATAAQLKASQDSAATLGTKLKRAESSEKSALSQLATVSAQANSYHDQANATALQLKASLDSVATLGAKLKRAESVEKATLSQLAVVTTQANSYLEQLRTREWRSGFDHNLFRELDVQIGAAQTEQRTLKSERDYLHDQVANLELKLGAQDKAIEKLQAAAADHAITFSKQANDLKHAEQVRAGLAAQLAELETERARLSTDLAARDRAVAEARAIASADAQRTRESLAGAERRESELAAQIAELRTELGRQIEALRAEQKAQIEQLQSKHAVQITEFQSEVQTREQEMTVLTAHLLEARRPLEPIEAEIKRLTEELSVKSTAFEELSEEHRKMRTSLERARGALEEREFLIRRLERSESNNANVLGRIQTSIERLGGLPPLPVSADAVASPTTEWLAELVRLEADGTRVTHALARRTRIGRAPGCELQIDSSSVSRNHALVLVGPRDTIIEDLNSTNGVIVNGRAVTRQLLKDGDLIMIGEIRFRYVARSTQRPPELPPAEPSSAG